MTGAAPQSPAMPRGRYWHVKACWRALKGLGVGMFVSFCIYVWWESQVWGHVAGPFAYEHQILLHTDSEPLAMVREPDLLLPETWGQPGYETFYDLLVRTLSYEPILAVVVGMLCCTILLEQVERRRQET